MYKRQIWLRRSFELSEVPAGPLRLELSHDDDVVVYLNGEPVYDSGEAYIGDYRFYDIPEKALNTLHKGRNVLALYCVSPRGGSYLDAGLVRPLPPAVSVQQARQQNVTVTATQTTCTFACGPVNLKVGFCSPLLADDLETLSRPVSYVTFTATPTDGQTHDVQVFFAASGRLAADQPTQTVAARFHEAGGLLVQQIGTESQQILGKKGDDRRIDWGYACLAVPKTAGAMAYSGPADALKNAFVSGKKEDNSATGPLPAAEAALGLALPLKAGQPAHLLLGYDDVYAVEYFGQKLRGWWRRDPAMTLDKALETAENQYESILKKCEAFDKKIYDDALKAGGKPLSLIHI